MEPFIKKDPVEATAPLAPNVWPIRRECYSRPQLSELILVCLAFALYKYIWRRNRRPPTTGYWQWAVVSGIGLAVAAVAARYALRQVVQTYSSHAFVSRARVPMAKMAAAAGILAAAAFNVGIVLAMRLPNATESLSEVAIMTVVVFSIPAAAFYFDPLEKIPKWTQEWRIELLRDSETSSEIHWKKPNTFFRKKSSAKSSSEETQNNHTKPSMLWVDTRNINKTPTITSKVLVDKIQKGSRGSNHLRDEIQKSPSKSPKPWRKTIQKSSKLWNDKMQQSPTESFHRSKHDNEKPPAKRTKFWRGEIQKPPTTGSRPQVHEMQKSFVAGENPKTPKGSSEMSRTTPKGMKYCSDEIKNAPIKIRSGTRKNSTENFEPRGNEIQTTPAESSKHLKKEIMKAPTESSDPWRYEIDESITNSSKSFNDGSHETQKSFPKGSKSRIHESPKSFTKSPKSYRDDSTMSFIKSFKSGEVTDGSYIDPRSSLLLVRNR